MIWPLMRRRLTFVASTATMFLIWWIYHAVLIFAGSYGFMGGIPAFTVGLRGFVSFVGVHTERSQSVWPSVLGPQNGHGSRRERRQAWSCNQHRSAPREFGGAAD